MYANASKHGHDRLCWLTQNRAAKWSCIQRLKVSEIESMSLVTPIPGRGRLSTVNQPTESRPPLRWWGIPPTHLNPSEGHRLPPVMRPKSLKYKTRIWAIMLKKFPYQQPQQKIRPTFRAELLPLCHHSAFAPDGRDDDPLLNISPPRRLLISSPPAAGGQGPEVSERLGDVPLWPHGRCHHGEPRRRRHRVWRSGSGRGGRCIEKGERSCSHGSGPIRYLS